MKASRIKTNTIGSLLAAAITALLFTVPANAGNTASGSVRLGVILVSTVQAEPQPAAQTVQFAMGNGATVRMDSANPAMKGQVRELVLVIGQAAVQTAQPSSAATLPTPQAAAKLLQTTFVAD